MGIRPRQHQSDQRRLGRDFHESRRSRNTCSSPCTVPFNLAVGSPRNRRESSFGRAGYRGGLTRYVKALSKYGRAAGRQSIRLGCQSRPTKVYKRPGSHLCILQLPGLLTKCVWRGPVFRRNPLSRFELCDYSRFQKGRVALVTRCAARRGPILRPWLSVRASRLRRGQACAHPSACSRGKRARVLRR
jgi:hypothetical protein